MLQKKLLGYNINLVKDEDGLWRATCEDIPALNITANTYELLLERVMRDLPGILHPQEDSIF